MGIEGFLASDEERAARTLVEQAALILKATDGDVPSSFVPTLFGRTAAEDILVYGAHELAAPRSRRAMRTSPSASPARPISASPRRRASRKATGWPPSPSSRSSMTTCPSCSIR